MDSTKINEDDVECCIKKLDSHKDAYTKGILIVFKNYLKHKDFKQMREELEKVEPSGNAFHNLWDINARITFLEVIYPC